MGVGVWVCACMRVCVCTTYMYTSYFLGLQSSIIKPVDLRESKREREGGREGGRGKRERDEREEGKKERERYGTVIHTLFAQLGSF